MFSSLADHQAKVSGAHARVIDGPSPNQQQAMPA
jgi:hypothetical protein